MLHTRWQQRYLGKQTLIRGASKDLMQIPFAAAVGGHDDDGWTEVFQEMPACAGNGEEVEGG